MRFLTERFWQMTAGFILTLFISIILMFIINQFSDQDNLQASPVSPDKVVAGSQAGH